MDKKLRLSSSNKCLGGVCGGFGDFFGIDPTIIRIIFGILLFASFFTIFVVYIILWAIIPTEARD